MEQKRRRGVEEGVRGTMNVSSPRSAQRELIQKYFDSLAQKYGFRLTNRSMGLIEYTKNKWIFRIMLSRFGEFEVNLVPTDAAEILAEVGYPVDWVLEFFSVTPNPDLVLGMHANTQEQADKNATIVCEAFDLHILPRLDSDKELPEQLLAYSKVRTTEYNARNTENPLNEKGK